MPPAISDDEMSDAGDVAVPIPTKREKSKSVSYKDEEEDELPAIKGDLNNGDNEDANEEEGDEDDEDMEEDEYVVEKIIQHVVQDGAIKFKVKWEGYEKKSDQTWEDEDNLRENASSVLDEYLESIGGRDMIFEESAKAAGGKKRGRPSLSAKNGTGKRSKTGHPASATPPASLKEEKWKAPAGSWEADVESIDACHDEQTGKLVVYLTWKNGHKTQHDTKVVYQRCPQKMLQFYERHVKIVKTSIDE